MRSILTTLFRATLFLISSVRAEFDFANSSIKGKTAKRRLVLVQFEKRQRRWLISAQGWSEATTLGSLLRKQPTLKGFALRETLSGLVFSFICLPRVLAALEPWAEISQRLRRFQTEPLPEDFTLRLLITLKKEAGTTCSRGSFIEDVRFDSSRRQKADVRY